MAGTDCTGGKKVIPSRKMGGQYLINSGTLIADSLYTGYGGKCVKTWGRTVRERPENIRRVTCRRAGTEKRLTAI